jgi:hypothetical protein
LNAALIYAKNKINKQTAVSCPNSTFTYWKKLMVEREVLEINYEGFLDKGIKNFDFFQNSIMNLEEGNIQFKDGKIIINGKESFYYYSKTYTNDKVDQVIVEVYYSETDNKVSSEFFLKDVKIIKFYLSLAARCKEELIKTLRNKSTCFPGLKNSFRLFNNPKIAATVEGAEIIDQVLIPKSLNKLDIFHENRKQKVITEPLIIFQHDKLLIEQINENVKAEIHYTIPEGHPCGKELFEIKQDAKTAEERRNKIENKFNAHSAPKSEPLHQADSCRDINDPNKIIFPYETTNKLRGIIISTLNVKKILIRENDKQRLFTYDSFILSCNDLVCAIEFTQPSLTFTFKFDKLECPELLKAAFSGQRLLTTYDYRNYYYSETQPKEKPNPINAYMDNSKLEIILSQSSFSI